MATRSTRALTKTASSNAKQSLRVMCMTALSAIHSCWAMKPPFMRMRLTVRKRPATSWNVLVVQIGIADQVQRKGYRNKPLSAKDRRRNDAIAVIRAGGERPFATYKSRDGLARARFMGLAKNRTAYGIAAIAHNLRKGAKFLTLYGLPNPNYAG